MSSERWSNLPKVTQRSCAHTTQARLPVRADRLFYEWMSKRLGSLGALTSRAAEGRYHLPRVLLLLIQT